MTDQECLEGFIVSTEEQKKQNNSILLSPNPVTNVINIKYLKHLSVNNIIITDITGKKIIEIYTKTKRNEIDISRLNTGIYFISFYQKCKLLITHKIIKK